MKLNSMRSFKSQFIFILLLTCSFRGLSQKIVHKPSYSVEDDTQKVKAILKNIDDYKLDMDTKMSVYDDSIVHMAQGNPAITNKTDLRKLLEAEASYGHSDMTHEIVTLQSYDDMVLTRGRVKGIYFSNNGGAAFPFETNNVIIFKRKKDGSLKVSQVIFNRIALENVNREANIFKKFIGEWALKDDNWTQNWGNGTEEIKIKNHHTINKELNTANSLLSVIDGTPPFGHIFWSYNPVKNEVNHLSSFGTTRAGVGKGTLNEKGDVSLKVSFADEAEGTYRLYTYKWVSDNEYELKSTQYNSKNEPTGFYYGGNFVRINK